MFSYSYIKIEYIYIYILYLFLSEYIFKYISLKQYDDVRVFNSYDVLRIFKKLYQRDLKDNLKRFKINIIRTYLYHKYSYFLYERMIYFFVNMII